MFVETSVRLLVLSQLLVLDFKFYKGKITGCGNPLRASTTKCVWETDAWPRMELGYGKNVEDWAIRRSAPKDDLLVNGAGSEIAKLSVCDEGLSSLSTLKVRSGVNGNIHD